MSLFMNMTLFSLFPGSERLLSIGCAAPRLTIGSRMREGALGERKKNK